MRARQSSGGSDIPVATGSRGAEPKNRGRNAAPTKADAKTTHTNPYSHFGVPTVINCVGFATRVGGSCPAPAVLDAMRAANESFVEIDDLQEAASKLIARTTDAEAGIVTCGAAAGLTLSF